MNEWEEYNTKIVINDRKAKKNHRCDICKSRIETGEVYSILTRIFLNQPVDKKEYTQFKTFKICMMHDVKKIKIEKNRIFEKEE